MQPTPKKATLTRASLRWHRRLGWVGGVALIVFGLSGLTHPLMTWFGPQQAAFFPPQGQFSEADVQAIPTLVQRHGIEQAQLVKLIPTAEGNRLQITEPDNPVRRYFDPDSGAELPDFDRRQAAWLARHYTGLSDTPIVEQRLQTAFDSAYPEVNRLLPVWKVVFDTDDRRTAFVHTELNALASLTNNFRTTQQGIFRSLHTFNWLDGWEAGRVTALLVLCGGLVLMSVTGMVMVFALPARRIPQARRRWHRWLAFGLWLPLLAFSVSGLYHLLHNAGDSSPQGLIPGPLLDLTTLTAQYPADTDADHTGHGAPIPLNSITLLQTPEGALYYRLAQPGGRPGQTVGHHARFDGTPTEQPSRLLSASTGAEATLDDRTLARHFAAAHLGLAADAVGDAEPVTGFGPDYDFRNKRLPVWRVPVQGSQYSQVFIDPANGALVDAVTRADRWEGYSFSHLHKWNFMTPFTGRQIRDGLIAATIVAALGFTLLGMSLLVRRRSSPARATAGSR